MLALLVLTCKLSGTTLRMKVQPKQNGMAEKGGREREREGATVQTKTSQTTAQPGGQRRYVELCNASLQLVSGAGSLEGPRK